MNDAYNIVFLDVDGVLNNITHTVEVFKQTHKPHSDADYPFDDKNLINLQKFVRMTNAKIVISSSEWRKHEDHRKVLKAKLEEFDLQKDVLGKTPLIDSQRRGFEINTYLKMLKKKTKRPVHFVILDDDRMEIEDLNAYRVKVKTIIGLTAENVEEAIEILNKQKEKNSKKTKPKDNHDER